MIVILMFRNKYRIKNLEKNLIYFSVRRALAYFFIGMDALLTKLAHSRRAIRFSEFLLISVFFCFVLLLKQRVRMDKRSIHGPNTPNSGFYLCDVSVFAKLRFYRQFFLSHLKVTLLYLQKLLLKPYDRMMFNPRTHTHTHVIRVAR